jgi:hypothetical protein
MLDLFDDKIVQLFAEGFGQVEAPIFEYYDPRFGVFELQPVSMLPVFGHIAIVRDANLWEDECLGVTGLIAQLRSSRDRNEPSLTVSQAISLRKYGLVEIGALTAEQRYRLENEGLVEIK